MNVRSTIRSRYRTRTGLPRSAMAEVETTRDGAVLTIALNRPDKLNAFDSATHEAFAGALKEARRSGGARRRPHRRRARVLRRAGPVRAEPGRPRRRRAPARALEPPRPRSARPGEAGARGRQWRRGRRRALARLRLRRTRRCRLGRVRPRFRQRRPRAGHGRLVARAAAPGLRPRVRVDVLGPQDRRRGGAGVGAGLRGRPGRRGRSRGRRSALPRSRRCPRARSR